MNKILIFLALATIVLVLYDGNVKPNFHYYRFAYEFPGALCLTHDCQKQDLGNISDFTITMHGFWPQSAAGIDNCLYNGYDETKLTADLLDELNANWVGTYSSTPTFRNHEWGKHGTCWAEQYYKNNTARFLEDDNYYDLFNEYFSLVMRLKKEAGLEALFFPYQTNKRVEYEHEDLMNLMRNHFGVVNVEVECEELDDVQYLTEARVCMDLDYQYIDCPTSFDSCNNGTVVVVAYINN